MIVMFLLSTVKLSRKMRRITKNRKRVISINALGANNTSTVNVITNHISNLARLDKNIQFEIYTYELSLLKKNLDLGNHKLSIKYYLIPSFAKLLPIRFITEQLIMPMMINRESTLISFNGYCLFLYSRTQITLCHNPYPLYLKSSERFRVSNIQWHLLYYLFKLTVKQSNNRRLVAFNSNHIRELFRLHYKFPRKLKSFLLYNSISQNGKLSKLQAAGKQDRRKKVFLAISPFSRYKQPHLIFKAFCQFAATDNDSELIYLGRNLDEEYFNKIKKDIPQELRDRIILLTKFISSEEIKNLYQRAFAYVSMSKCESFGLPAIEAQKYGVPAIVLAGTAAEEICGDGAIVVKESSSESLWKQFKKCRRIKAYIYNYQKTP